MAESKPDDLHNKESADGYSARSGFSDSPPPPKNLENLIFPFYFLCETSCKRQLETFGMKWAI